MNTNQIKAAVAAFFGDEYFAQNRHFVLTDEQLRSERKKNNIERPGFFGALIHDLLTTCAVLSVRGMATAALLEDARGTERFRAEAVDGFLGWERETDADDDLSWTADIGGMQLSVWYEEADEEWTWLCEWHANSATGSEQTFDGAKAKAADVAANVLWTTRARIDALQAVKPESEATNG